MQEDMSAKQDKSDGYPRSCWVNVANRWSNRFGLTLAGTVINIKYVIPSMVKKFKFFEYLYLLTIEFLIIGLSAFQQAVDKHQKLTHVRCQCYHFLFRMFSHYFFIKDFQCRVMLDCTAGRHIQRLTNLSVSQFGNFGCALPIARLIKNPSSTL
jgi:hypothetical protein